MIPKHTSALVTGSSGFVGRHLIQRLREEGIKVVCFDVTDNKDVTRWPDWEACPHVDLVYHLAAITFVPASQKNPRHMYHVNVSGTINALEFCRLNRAKMIFASSYVYGNPEYLPVDEEHPVNPTNPYARSKVAAELLCRAYSEDFGMRCVVLRPFNIIGEGQGRDFLVPEIVNQIRSGTEVILKDLTPRRDLLHISDAVDAYVKAGEYEGPACDVFNIGSGKSYSVREIAERLIQLSGKDVTLKSLGTKRAGEINETVADIRKAEKLLAWTPEVDIDQGLGAILQSR